MGLRRLVWVWGPHRVWVVSAPCLGSFGPSGAFGTFGAMQREYDRRRPRITVELGRLVDGARGQVPFDRFVRETLEQALGSSGVPGVTPLPLSDPPPARAS